MKALSSVALNDRVIQTLETAVSVGPQEADSLVQVGKCDPTERAKASHLQHASVFYNFDEPKTEKKKPHR